jgi:shikimate dehydrogenase
MLAGVIGDPLSHTLSPAMHNAAYDALDLDWVYIPLHVRDEMGLHRLVAAMRSMRFVGFNVTMPYKQTVLELCDELSTAASMAGAVNTVHCHEGRLIGYNTDGRGLLESLSVDAGFQPEGSSVVLLGAGGAAGSAAVSLMLAKVARLTIVNRNIEKADELVDRMEPQAHAVEMHTCMPHYSEEAVRGADLIINATSVGMRPGEQSPIDTGWLRPGQVVYDMVYGRDTALLSEAAERGAVVRDGLGMLVAQGAIAIETWAENRPVHAPREIMRSAAQQALAERASSE